MHAIGFEGLMGFCGAAGFNISLEPGFSVIRLAWLLAYGGVYAVANLRCACWSCIVPVWFVSAVTDTSLNLLIGLFWG